MTGAQPYRQRDARAAHLAGERPHASEILGLYRQVLALQEPLYASGRVAPWSAGGVAALPFGELDAPFLRFVGELIDAVPGALAAAGRSLAECPEATRRQLLRRTLEVGELGEIAASLGADLPVVTFWSRAFLAPLAEAAASRQPSTGIPAPPGTDAAEGGDAGAGAGDEPRGTCPRCGWPAQVSVVEDVEDRRGGRSLVCALCATQWPFSRVRCPSCGERTSEALAVHTTETLPHVRVEECKSCHAYWKSVDLRANGHAVPVVEDLASPELDLWAEEQDLWKLCRNLIGL